MQTTINEHPRPMTAPGVREETVVPLRYKVNGSAVMSDTSLVRARGVRGATVASPLLSMVRRSSATVVSGESPSWLTPITQQRYEEQQRQRSIAALKRRAAALGFHINPLTAAAA